MFFVRGRSIITSGGTGNLSIEPYENIFPDVLKVCGKKDTNDNYVFPSNVYNYVIKIQNLTSQSKLIPIETGQFRLINSSTIQRLNINSTFNNGTYIDDDINIVSPLNVPANAIIEVIGYNLNDNINTTQLTSDVIALSDAKIYTNDTINNYTVTVSSSLQLEGLAIQQLSTGSVTLTSGTDVVFVNAKTGEVVTSLTTDTPGQQLMLFKTGVENKYIVADSNVDSQLFNDIADALTGKADLEHFHYLDEISDFGDFVTTLDQTLTGKVNTSDLSNALNLKVDKVLGKGLSTNDYTDTEKTKLSGIANNATANDTDTNLKSRSNHTGTQAISTIVGLQTALDNITTAISQQEISVSSITTSRDTTSTDKILTNNTASNITINLVKDTTTNGLILQQLSTGSVTLTSGTDVTFIDISTGNTITTISTSGKGQQILVNKTSISNLFIINTSNALDATLNSLRQLIDERAPISHQHQIDDVDNLEDIINDVSLNVGVRFISNESENVLKNDKRLTSISTTNIKLTINKDLIVDLDIQQLNTGDIELIAGPDVFLIGQSLNTDGVYNQLMIRKTAFANTYIVTRIGGDMVWNGIESIVPFDNGTTIFDNGSTVFTS